MADTLAMLRRKIKPETVMGHTLPEPKLTVSAGMLIAWRVLLPVLIIGSVLDLLVQWFFGVCTGLWCFINESA